MEIITKILSYIIFVGFLLFNIRFLMLIWRLFKVDLNQPIFKETIEITFKSKDDEDKKDD